jgi:hypothetical protein
LTAHLRSKQQKTLEPGDYDIVVLVIMGVKGFELLDIAKQKNIPALMQTAHALNKESLKESAENGASYYIPKEEIGKIDVFVADVLEAVENNKNPWVRWYERLCGFFDNNIKRLLHSLPKNIMGCSLGAVGDEHAMVDQKKDLSERKGPKSQGLGNSVEWGR